MFPSLIQLLLKSALQSLGVHHSIGPLCVSSKKHENQAIPHMFTIVGTRISSPYHKKGANIFSSRNLFFRFPSNEHRYLGCCPLPVRVVNEGLSGRGPHPTKLLSKKGRTFATPVPLGPTSCSMAEGKTHESEKTFKVETC